jgi:4-amino-4-deoxy-L-arabinose transferase-like glycosyltransferase
MNISLEARRGHLASVFLCALVFRLIFFGWALSGWHTEPQSGMSQYYFRQGYGLAAGYGLVSWQGEGGDQLKHLYALVESGHLAASPSTAPPLNGKDVHFDTFHPPGMAILVAALHRVLGTPADLPVEILGVLFDAIAAVLLCWLVGRAIAPDVGYATGLLYAFFPPAAHAASSRTPEGFIALFVIAAVASFWLACAPGKGRWWRWSALAGLMLGVASYFRPDYLWLPMALAVGAWAITREFWPSLKAALLVQCICFVVLLPWASRNHGLTGRWLFTGSVVGPTLITGLAEFHNPWGYGVSDMDRQAQARAAGLESWTSSAADVYFRQLFFRSIEEKPYGYLMAVAKRVPFAVAPPLDIGLENPYRKSSFAERRQANGSDRYAAVRKAPFRILLAYGDMLAMAGVTFLALVAWAYLAWRERRQWGLCLFLFMPHFYAVSTHLLTHFEPRFLSPSIGFLLIGLGYVAALIAARRSTSSPSVAMPVTASSRS